MCVCVYSLTTNCSVCVVLFVFWFSRLTTWYWITNGVVFLPVKTYLSHFSIPYLGVVVCAGLRPHGLSPAHINMPVIVLVQLMFMQLGRFCGCGFLQS